MLVMIIPKTERMTTKQKQMTGMLVDVCMYDGLSAYRIAGNFRREKFLEILERNNDFQKYIL